MNSNDMDVSTLSRLFSVIDMDLWNRAEMEAPTGLDPIESAQWVEDRHAEYDSMVAEAIWILLMENMEKELGK